MGAALVAQTNRVIHPESLTTHSPRRTTMKYPTRKSTAEAKAETLRRRQIRRSKGM